MSAEVNRYPSYGWVVLGMAWLTMVMLMWGWQMLPALFLTETGRRKRRSEQNAVRL